MLLATNRRGASPKKPPDRCGTRFLPLLFKSFVSQRKKRDDDKRVGERKIYRLQVHARAMRIPARRPMDGQRAAQDEDDDEDESKSPDPTDIQLFLFPLTSVYVPRSLFAWTKYGVH